LGINATQDSLILSNGGGSVALTDLGISSGDNQNLRFSTNGDSILIEDGNGVGIQFILDDITNNTVNISNNQTSISNESASRSAADNNLSTRLVNDSSNLVDTAAVLRALIHAASQDDQNLSFSPTRDSILIENGTGIRIQFIIDTATNL